MTSSADDPRRSRKEIEKVFDVLRKAQKKKRKKARSAEDTSMDGWSMSVKNPDDWA